MYSMCQFLARPHPQTKGIYRALHGLSRNTWRLGVRITACPLPLDWSLGMPFMAHLKQQLALGMDK
jgi:hypothetical protein